MNLLHELHEALSEKELIHKTHHKKMEQSLLTIRNLAVGIASLLFLIAICPGITRGGVIKAVAYFFGAVAYFSELLMLTDVFRKRIPHEELFMVYCFGPMYILMGFSYLYEH